MAVDEQKVEEAVGKVFGELGTAIAGPLIVLGDRLGLWAALAGADPVMPGELAAGTASLIGVFEGFTGLWNDLGTVEGFFRAGGGMSWGDHHPALGAMAGEARIRQVLAEAGYTRVRRVAVEAAPFNIVLEARP